MIPPSLTWFREGSVNHSANGIYARVSGKRDFHAMPLTLHLRALEVFMPITEKKLSEKGADTEQAEPR